MQLLFCSLQFRVIIHHPPFGAAASTNVLLSLSSEEKQRRNAFPLVRISGIMESNRCASWPLRALLLCDPKRPLQIYAPTFFWAIGGGFGGAPTLCNTPPVAPGSKQHSCPSSLVLPIPELQGFKGHTPKVKVKNLHIIRSS